MDKENEVRLIAYRIWEEAGCCDGRDFDHWLMAETIWEQMQDKEKKSTRAKPEQKVEVGNVKSSQEKPATKSTSAKPKTAAPKAGGARRTKKS